MEPLPHIDIAPMAMYSGFGIDERLHSDHPLTSQLLQEILLGSKHYLVVSQLCRLDDISNLAIGLVDNSRGIRKSSSLAINPPKNVYATGNPLRVDNKFVSNSNDGEFFEVFCRQLFDDNWETEVLGYVAGHGSFCATIQDVIVATVLSPVCVECFCPYASNQDGHFCSSTLTDASGVQEAHIFLSFEVGVCSSVFPVCGEC